MPWLTKTVTKLKNDLEALVVKEFKIDLNCPVLLCTAEELKGRIKTEEFFCNLPKEKKKIVSHRLQFILGKYFSNTREIWLVHGKGDKKEVIFHEMLHSIQKCSPNRENITDYITWWYFKDSRLIDPYTLKDWKEIERMVGFQVIKKRFLTEGDCEEF